MLTLQQRVEWAFARKKERDPTATHAALARAAGVRPPSVKAWFDGGTKTLKGESAVRAARYLGVNADWLTAGLGPREPSGDAVENVTSDPIPFRGRVPLISWTTAGQWAEVQDLHPPGNGDEWIATTARVGPHAFALRVQGDSMEPKVPDGCIVIIDPDRGHHHGSIVLAKRVTDQSATLKQLWYDGDAPKLRPLNDRYPILDMPNDTRIIGVAVRIELDL